ncbi:MAG: AraC family transcriptional regulator [Gemmatimonadaceae bacterium]|jgi:AraC-like DNA-binding protein|nr:AraC family transcriptional regulator [Gemmatimonadaceae bacterium]
MAAFYAAIGGTMEEGLECTVHPLEELHGRTPYASPLFRANYYSIVLVRTGRGAYHLDSVTYPTRPRTLYFTNPGHVKGFRIDRPATGWVITFSEAFLKTHGHVDLVEDFPFLIADTVPPRVLSADDFAPFAQLAAQLRDAFVAGTPSRPRLLASLLVVLLLRLKDAFWSTYDPRDEPRPDTHIVTVFQRNLASHVRALVAGTTHTQWGVKDFAHAQHLHPSYFSTVIRQKTGRPVGEWIDAKLLGEAQALLTRTPLSLKEVAFRLGFREAGHFSRFFRAQTGQTPSAYRVSRGRPAA